MAGNGNKDTQKSPIKIRFKAMKNGYQSIYLDCYHDGHRSYEYLKLYLVTETETRPHVRMQPPCAKPRPLSKTGCVN